MSSKNNSRKRRYLDKLITDLQNSNKNSQQDEPILHKTRVLAVPLCHSLQPIYEFFLIGEINIELNLDVEEDYYPIGVKQSPLNKWRPFQKAELFHNRVEVTIDASHPGLSEFEFLIQKLHGCSNAVLKQLGLYLRGYQDFVRRIKQKMMQNPVPHRLYEFKLQNFLKAAQEFVGNLPVDSYYAVSVMQLDYNIHNTKRIKFIVSKAISELISGQDYSEAADILLRKGWMEVFGGPQRILKNIMLLNRLMKEGKQLLTFSISTIDKIKIQVQAEIEIIQSLRSYVDVGFVEIIRFTISPDVIAELAATRRQLQDLHGQKQQQSTDIPYRHPNFDQHETDLAYNSNCKQFVQKFYSKQELPRYLNNGNTKALIRLINKTENTSNYETNSIQVSQDSCSFAEGFFGAFDGSCCSSNHEEFFSQLPTHPIDSHFFLEHQGTATKTISKDIQDCKDQDNNYILQNNENIVQPSKILSPVLTFSTGLKSKQELVNHSNNIINSEEILSNEFCLDEKMNKFTNNDGEGELENHEYFNIFDDESLNMTAQDLRDQQKRIKKLLYQQYKDSFH